MQSMAPDAERRVFLENRRTKIGLSTSSSIAPRSWVIEHYRLTARVFQIMSQPAPPNFETILPAVRRQFRSLSERETATLQAFFNTFHGVFQATKGIPSRMEMIRDLTHNAKIIFRLCQQSISFNFNDKDILHLQGTIELHLHDLNDTDCSLVKTSIAQNWLPFEILANILNCWLNPLGKTVHAISALNIVAPQFDAKKKSLDFIFPLGLYLVTRPIDVYVSLPDLKEEIELDPFYQTEIRPYQRLVVIEIPEEIGLFFHLYRGAEETSDWIGAFFSQHQLQLHAQSYLWMSFDSIGDTLTFCSDRAIIISKLPVESER